MNDTFKAYKSSSKSSASEAVIPFGNSAVDCGEGKKPSVALAHEKVVVLVYEGQGEMELHYCVGVVGERGAVEWGKRHQCEKGINPSVASNGMLTVVVVYEDEESKLCCKYGIVNPETKELTWSKSQFYSWGTQPTVALRVDGKVVEMHEEKHCFKKHLYYRLGQLDTENKRIRW